MKYKSVVPKKLISLPVILLILVAVMTTSFLAPSSATAQTSNLPPLLSLDELKGITNAQDLLNRFKNKCNKKVQVVAGVPVLTQECKTIVDRLRTGSAKCGSRAQALNKPAAYIKSCQAKIDATPGSPAQVQAVADKDVDIQAEAQKLAAKQQPMGDLDFGKKGTHQCGNLANDKDNFKTKINFGCLGKKGPSGLGPIQDLLFALIRFLSMGVGIIITLALIASGVQYTMAEGNSDATHKAKKRMQTALIGLAIFIFAWSALQFLIPGGLFRPGVWLL